MIQYTTPRVTLRIKNVELDQTDAVKLALRPYDKTAKKLFGTPLIFVNPTVTVADGNTRVSVRLTQAQSGSLPVGLVAAQANWKHVDGLRGATKRAYLTVEENLIDEEM